MVSLVKFLAWFNFTWVKVALAKAIACGLVAVTAGKTMCYEHPGNQPRWKKCYPVLNQTKFFENFLDGSDSFAYSRILKHPMTRKTSLISFIGLCFILSYVAGNRFSRSNRRKGKKLTVFCVF